MTDLQEEYDALLHKHGFIDSKPGEISEIIRRSLIEFTGKCKNPAIWCYGTHTQMLMADFMAELKGVKYIIDKNASKYADAGFQFITDDQIENQNIDGVIISTYLFRDNVRRDIEAGHPGLKFLDIYEELKAAGLPVTWGYYQQGPHMQYNAVIRLQNDLYNCVNESECQELYHKIIEKYLQIKDFRSALYYANEAAGRLESDRFEEIAGDINLLYGHELEAAAKMSKESVLMLCLDGLRREDILDHSMPQTELLLNKRALVYDNAYSVSTSTYESLIPAYSERNSFNTEYYKTIEVPEGGCRFINLAKEQGREIYSYTDQDKYFAEKDIHYHTELLSAAAKFWTMLNDSIDEKNGLYYVHIQYETHFAFSNPYTTGVPVTKGTHVFFDFLKTNGGYYQTDYALQHRNAMHYLDDTLFPFLEKLSCKIVIYADHGNIVPDVRQGLESLSASFFSYSEQLLRIPFAVISPQVRHGRNHDLFSLMRLNEVVINLLNSEDVKTGHVGHIKCQRSEIYNPDLRYIYKKYDKEQELLAFETFIFEDGYKLSVYGDGSLKLSKVCDDVYVDDADMMREKLVDVKNEITVCKLDKISSVKL
ncbi:MAG: hypothetical protein K2J60_19080 [Acetatifactor sp.]|nr:hypothetical protein [Acetatifactor sp.]